MHTVCVNRTASYLRFQQREARQAIAGMSYRERQLTLDTIKVQQGTSHLIGQSYNAPMLHYIKGLLTGGEQ